MLRVLFYGEKMELANKNAVVEMLKRGKENILLFFEEFYAYEYENSFTRMAEVEKEVKDATEKISTTKSSETDNGKENNE